jgi:hypothetical protein
MKPSSKVSLGMVERGVVKQPLQIVVEMTLERGEEGVGAMHGRHQRKSF